MKKAIGIQLEDKVNVYGSIDVKIEVKTDTEGKIISGLVIGSTLQQNKAILLSAHPGDIKTAPTVGVGISDFLHDDDYQKYRSIIPEHFAKDGLKTRLVKFGENIPLDIDCSYE